MLCLIKSNFYQLNQQKKDIRHVYIINLQMVIEIQIKNKHGTTTMQSMAKVAMIEPWSNAFLKPTRVKCWNAKNTTITKERTTPSCLPL